MSNQPPVQPLDIDRKRRIRRNVVLLVVLAIAFEVGYILLNIPRA